MPALDTLTVNNNRITSIDSILLSQSLRNLYVDNNKIAKIQIPAGEGSTVTRLSLHGNYIENVDFVNELSSINYLDLSANRIMNINNRIIDLINNYDSAFILCNQEFEIIIMDTKVNLEKNNNYTNLLEWANYFADKSNSGSTVSTSTVNGTLDGYVFTLQDEKEVGKLKIDNGPFQNSVINISYASSKAQNADLTSNTVDNTTEDTNTATATNTTDNTASGNTAAGNKASTNIDTTTEKGGATTSDGTTASGKMPYTGITTKIVGIAVLVISLGLVGVYTYLQNKKNVK